MKKLVSFLLLVILIPSFLFCSDHSRPHQSVYAKKKLAEPKLSKRESEMFVLKQAEQKEFEKSKVAARLYLEQSENFRNQLRREFEENREFFKRRFNQIDAEYQSKPETEVFQQDGTRTIIGDVLGVCGFYILVKKLFGV